MIRYRVKAVERKRLQDPQVNIGLDARFGFSSSRRVHQERRVCAIAMRALSCWLRVCSCLVRYKGFSPSSPGSTPGLDTSVHYAFVLLQRMIVKRILIDYEIYQTNIFFRMSSFWVSGNNVLPSDQQIYG